LSQILNKNIIIIKLEKPKRKILSSIVSADCQSFLIKYYLIEYSKIKNFNITGIIQIFSNVKELQFSPDINLYIEVMNDQNGQICKASKL